MSNINDLPYDDETSSDEELEEFKYPYGLFKPGREYIYLSSKYGILVPALEFSKVYKKDLEILQKNASHTEIKNGSMTYTFDINLCDRSNLSDVDKKIRSFSSGIDNYADDAPHCCNSYAHLPDQYEYQHIDWSDIVKLNKPWYKESIGNYALGSYRFGSLSLEAAAKQQNCKVIESYIFNGYW